MLGWTPGTYDAHDALKSLAATRDGKGRGRSTSAATRNPKLDELTKKIQVETDAAKRNAHDRAKRSSC